MKEPAVIVNSPIAPSIALFDLVTIETGNPSRALTGYVAEMSQGCARMHYGPTFPLSSVTRFIQRNGAPIPRGMASLPVNGF